MIDLMRFRSYIEIVLNIGISIVDLYFLKSNTEEI